MRLLHQAQAAARALLAQDPDLAGHPALRRLGGGTVPGPGGRLQLNRTEKPRPLPENAAGDGGCYCVGLERKI